MPKNNKQLSERAAEMTQVSISIPEELLKKVDRLSKQERRSRSNYITKILEDVPEEGSFLEAAEPQEEFRS